MIPTLRRPAWRRVCGRLPSLTAWAAILAVAGFTGCTKEGVVRVINETSYQVSVSIMQSDQILIPAGAEHVETVKVSKGFFPPSEREIEIEGEGIVKQPFSARLIVEDGGDPSYVIQADAGALILINELECSTQETQIRQCDVGQWGDNQLAAPLRPEGGRRNFRLEPGCYDMRVRAQSCPEDPFRRDYLGLDIVEGVADTIRFRLTGPG
ncbi:MAG: hypothetical protein GF355_15645 [Candidatus Eisenbacteria bacterium]|nr:hypothetical protein [Candidatus Eisenbacteria bacterium]